MTDRLASGYEPRFDLDYEIGAQAELYINDIVEALRSGSSAVEVKADEKATLTGRVYVEYECQRGGRYQPSGIQTTEADVWVIVIGGNVAVVAPTKALRAAADKGTPRECMRGSHPTKGRTVPLNLLLNWTIQAHMQSLKDIA